MRLGRECRSVIRPQYSRRVGEAVPPTERIRQILLDPDLCRARRVAAIDVTRSFETCGAILQTLGRATDDEQLESSPSSSDEATFAVGVLARIAAELAGVSSRLLSGAHHYAGAALLRQIVEIEYLTWAFANAERDAAVWLNSTRQQRMELFAPARLRDISDGRFKKGDYQHHCEQGGHPVPRAVTLVGGANPESAQMLLVDLLLHCWRIADNLVRWLQSADNTHVDIHRLLDSARRTLTAWGERDPLYAWACSLDDPASAMVDAIDEDN